MEQARRYNKGKLRYELISKIATREKARVYTGGAHKYTLYKDAEGNVIKGSDISLQEASDLEVFEDGSYNWKKGLPWTDVLESSRRHLEAFAAGEDFDPDLGTYHLANLAWNVDVLLEQYVTHPELDDRKNTYFNKRVGLDVDGILFDYSTAFCEWAGIEKQNNHWLFSYTWEKRHRELYDNKDFWVNLKPLQDGKNLPFDPVCYCTNRHIPTEWTEEALEKNGFPCAPVLTVQGSKVDVLKNIEIDLFVDDYYGNFTELNNAGVFCYLYDRPYNQKYPVGHRRIYSLDEIVKRK